MNGALIMSPTYIRGPASITSGEATRGVLSGLDRRVRQSVFQRQPASGPDGSTLPALDSGRTSRAGLSGRSDIQTARGTGVSATAPKYVRRGDKTFDVEPGLSSVETIVEAFKLAAEAGYLGRSGGTSNTYIRYAPGMSPRDIESQRRTQYRREGQSFARGGL